MDQLSAIIPLIIGWSLDLIFGDPRRLPHLVVGFGQLISFGEHRLNRGSHRILRGGCLAIGLTLIVGAAAYLLTRVLAPVPLIDIAVESIIIFYCLAGTTLIREVKMVFEAADRSLAESRRQVGRIVGRDTQSLSDNEVRTAALETLAENLNDGVIAPLFWYAVLGLPGMVAYKMINTLDSMIGYRNERFILFGRVAARLDDIAGFIPARLTALLMIIAARRLDLLSFVRRFGRAHLSPNSGYPEAALAGILDCRFGGTHDYFGQAVAKPVIGFNHRKLTSADMLTAIAVNRRAEILAVILAAALRALLSCLT